MKKRKKYNIKNTNKYYKTKGIANCLTKIISAVLLICMLLTLTNIKDTSASFNDNKPVFKTDGYHTKMCYSTSAAAIGEIHYQINADLTNMDEMVIPHAIATYKCCDNVVPPSGNGLWVKVNGNLVYTDTDQQVTTNINWPDIKSPGVDIRNYRKKDSVINFDAKAEVKTCENCGKKPTTQIVYYGIEFYDYRGVATMQSSRMTVTKNETVTLSPSYNEYTDHVAWAVRYPGESEFSLLSEGANRGGIVASGVKNRSISLSSIPFTTEGIDIGVFVYDADGSLPAGTSFPNTPFFTRLINADNEGPIIDIEKTIDKENRAIIVTVNATDESGLPTNAYSWDGGNTFTANNVKTFISPGTYEVVVKDISGNISRKSFYIDSSDIDKLNPKKTNEKPVDETPEESKKGGTNTDSDGNKGNTGTENKPSITSTEKPDNIKKQLESEESVTVNPIPITNKEDTSDSSKAGNETDTSAGTGQSKKKSGNSKNSSPSTLSEDKKKGIFDKIKENSENYIISMHDATSNDNEIYKDKNEESNAAIDMGSLESGDKLNVKNENDDASDLYTPSKNKKPLWLLVLIALIVIGLLLLLLFFLFFGVIISTDKETELSELYGDDCMKIPVAISFVTYEKGQFSVCFRELLNKYGMVYARFGIVFSKIYEGEIISITTKFKGDKKREIAKEQIKSEIIVGIKGGIRR